MNSSESDKPPLVDNLVTAKICRNIASIAETKGYLNDCIKMNEQCLMLKIKALGHSHTEVLISQIQCALALEKVGDV
jgi:type IV secretory pathway protease TraF